MEVKKYRYRGKFELEAGGHLTDPVIGYHTFGELNERKNNVIWVCHALTANSNVPQWWGGLFGPEGIFSPENYFIVSVNMLGSCYGSTGPADINPESGEPYYYNFPLVTMRDVVKAHLILKAHLGIEEVQLCAGGSCGGNQVLEMCIQDPGIKQAFIIASSARESAWSIAIHTAQRLAIEADKNWGTDSPEAGIDGLRSARGIGLLSYRTIEAYKNRQTDDDEKLDDFKAASYIKYQGEKLVKRFNAHSYWHMTKTLDTHHIGRGRGKIEDVLGKIKSKMLIMGINSDMLIPPDEQKFIANRVPGAQFKMLESEFGHDGFLIEQEKISVYLKKFIDNGI